MLLHPCWHEAGTSKPLPTPPEQGMRGSNRVTTVPREVLMLGEVRERTHLMASNQLMRKK